jgi:uncharacterized membrane protein
MAAVFALIIGCVHLMCAMVLLHYSNNERDDYRSALTFVLAFVLAVGAIARMGAAVWGAVP